jgi:hypothetical protein
MRLYKIPVFDNSKYSYCRIPLLLQEKGLGVEAFIHVLRHKPDASRPVDLLPDHRISSVLDIPATVYLHR